MSVAIVCLRGKICHILPQKPFGGNSHLSEIKNCKSIDCIKLNSSKLTEKVTPSKDEGHKATGLKFSFLSYGRRAAEGEKSSYLLLGPAAFYHAELAA
jgi:hypothetical protein